MGKIHHRLQASQGIISWIRQIVINAKAGTTVVAAYVGMDILPCLACDQKGLIAVLRIGNFRVGGGGILKWEYHWGVSNESIFVGICCGDLANAINWLKLRGKVNKP